MRPLAMLLLAAGCARPAASPPPEARTLQRGERHFTIPCSSVCRELEQELARLQADCQSHPLSTARAVVTEPRALALACCIEAESLVEEACGATRCLRAWAGRCGQ